MFWVVAFRVDGEMIRRRTVSGRAAAIVAAAYMVDNGIEVISVTNENEREFVPAEAIRLVRDLRHGPHLVSFGIGRKHSKSGPSSGVRSRT